LAGYDVLLPDLKIYCDARVSDSGSPAPLRATEIRLQAPVCLYLSRMSFLTFVTPLTLRATSAALYILAWVLTKPLN
jgi:hypothetical protein